MKITTTNDNKSKKNKTNKNVITISGEEYTKPDKLSSLLICNYCNRTLSKIEEDNDNTFWCNKCSIEFQPEQVRRKSKITVPAGQNTETLVAATTPDPVSEFDKKPVKLKGGLKALQQKGIKITNYQEHIPK